MSKLIVAREIFQPFREFYFLQQFYFPGWLRLFLKKEFSYFFLKDFSFWVIQTTCDLSPSTEDFML